MTITFEVLEVKAKRTASVDCEYTIKLATEDPKVLELQKYIANNTVEMEIKE